MKKKIRKLNCLLLVAVLVACMVVPAMAAEGTGTSGSYDYKWLVTCTADEGVAGITTHHAPASVQARVSINAYNAVDGTGISRLSPTASGYVMTRATVSTLEGYTVESAVGMFWVAGQRVPDCYS